MEGGVKGADMKRVRNRSSGSPRRGEVLGLMQRRQTVQGLQIIEYVIAQRCRAEISISAMDNSMTDRAKGSGSDR